jgi:uncharacterized protein YutE (UPF0331/DUF86 family)
VNLPAEAEARIVEQATYLQEALTVLSETQSLDEETYRTDRKQRAIVERECQTAIEACIDIAGVLLTASAASMPETNAGRRWSSTPTTSLMLCWPKTPT